MGHFLLPIGTVTKVSTAMCATAFEDLEAVLALLDTTRPEFNPVQRELIDRFIRTSQDFSQHMLVAEGNRKALRGLLGLPPEEATSDKS